MGITPGMTMKKSGIGMITRSLTAGSGLRSPGSARRRSAAMADIEVSDQVGNATTANLQIHGSIPRQMVETGVTIGTILNNDGE